MIRNTLHDHRIMLDCTSGGESYGGLRVLSVSVLWLGLGDLGIQDRCPSNGALRPALDHFLFSFSQHLSAGAMNAAPEAAVVSVYSSPKASFSSAA